LIVTSSIFVVESQLQDKDIFAHSIKIVQVQVLQELKVFSAVEVFSLKHFISEILSKLSEKSIFLSNKL
jgi:hypothetical protein